jgi:signal transduction histidine kinase
LVDLPEKAGGRMKLRLSGQTAPQHRRRVAGLVLGGVIYVGLSVGAAAVLTRRWLRALGRMSEAARRLGLDPTSKGRLPVPKTEVELAAFAETLNGFLDRLEADYGARNRFLADAAHELRTPLTALRAEIDVALRRDREPARYRQVLESNREEIVRLSELIDGLLTLARADAGESIRPNVPLDSVPLAAQAVERFRPLALQRGIDLKLSQEGGPGATIPVRADARSVERILDNLLSNALRHTDAGGRITVSGRTGGSQAILEVTDTGTGIPPAHVARVFDRFYRVESGRGAGAGLGLAIVKALVEALGGDVRLESELGRGTRVEVRLPLA